MTRLLVIQPYYVGRWNRIYRALGLTPKDTPRPSVLKEVLGEPELEPRSIHGTRATYQAHLRDGEQPCEECRAATEGSLPSGQQAAEWGWAV